MGAPFQRGWRLFLDPMLTAPDKLDKTRVSWYKLLSGWSLDRSLATRADPVLKLDSENAIDGADDLLQSYTSHWSLGDFESLPPIVLLLDEYTGDNSNP